MTCQMIHVNLSQYKRDELQEEMRLIFLTLLYIYVSTVFGSNFAPPKVPHL